MDYPILGHICGVIHPLLLFFQYRARQTTSTSEGALIALAADFAATALDWVEENCDASREAITEYGLRVLACLAMLAPM
jgi:uncharacterized membrane protein YgcG